MIVRIVSSSRSFRLWTLYLFAALCVLHVREQRTVAQAGGWTPELTLSVKRLLAVVPSPDGSSIAFVMADPKSDEEDTASKEKRDWRRVDQNVKMKRLYALQVTGSANERRVARRLTAGNYSVEDFDWSPDGRNIVIQ